MKRDNVELWKQAVKITKQRLGLPVESFELIKGPLGIEARKTYMMLLMKNNVNRYK